MILFLLLLACAGCRPDPETGAARDRTTAPERAVAESAPAGQVRSGRFEDAARGFTIAVPEGWSYRIGQREGELRVALRHEETGARLLVYTSAPAPLDPPPRRECSWDFMADGGFRSLPGVDEVRVASCVPDDPRLDRVFAWLLTRNGWLWRFELHTPSDRMVDAKDAGEHLMRTLRW